LGDDGEAATRRIKKFTGMKEDPKKFTHRDGRDERDKEKTQRKNSFFPNHF
jgi:hypothetical protein